MSFKHPWSMTNEFDRSVHPADIYMSRKTGIPANNSPLCNEAAKKGKDENNVFIFPKDKY